MDKYERRRQRLLAVRDILCRGSNTLLANKIGRDASYVSRMLAEPGKTGRKRIAEDMVEIIEDAFPWGHGWFESEDPLPGSGVTTISEGRVKPTRFDASVEIPRFEAIASSGHGKPRPEGDGVVEVLRVSGEWLRNTLPQISSPANLAVLPAYGDSMEPTFSDSDLLWVDRGVTDVKIDAVYVLALRDELYVKRLQRRPDGAILMISDNKSYDPYVIKNGEREQFSVLGRVVFAWRGKRL